MIVKDLKQILRDIPDNYFVSLSYNNKKEKKFLKIECLDEVGKEERVITLRIKFEETYS